MVQVLRAALAAVVLVGVVGVAGAAGPCAPCGPGGGFPLPSGPVAFDLLEGRLRVELFPERGLLEGSAVLWGKTYGPVFPFALASRALIRSVSLVDGTVLAIERAGDRVEARLPLYPTWGRHVGLKILWSLRLGGPAGRGPVGACLSPAGGYLPSAVPWHPRGVHTDRATWQCIVRSPRDWRSLGSGREAQRWMGEGALNVRWRVDEATTGVSFLGGRYVEVAQRPWWQGDLAAWCLEGSTAPLALHVERARAILEFFRRGLGDPVFTGWTLAELPGDSGLGFRSAAEDAFAAVASPPREVAGPYLEFLGTELARGWFERRVRFRDHLGEALCVYGGLLALRKFGGRDEFLRSAREKASQYRAQALEGLDARPAGLSGLGDNVDAATYYNVAWRKAPLLLLWLEQACGGLRKFLAILRSFCWYHRDGQPVGWPELLEVAEKESGVELSTFALLHLDGRGLPPEVEGAIGVDMPPDVVPAPEKGGAR